MRKIRRALHASSLVLLLVTFGLFEGVSAQTRATTADLVGVIKDSTDAVLPGATVTVTNLDTNQVRSTRSGDDGRYAIPALAPGVYRVSVVLQGFKEELRENIEFSLGSLVELNVTLGLSGATETVQVNAEAPVADMQKTAVATVVSQRHIEGLPIDGRNFISFAVITPAVSTDRTPQQGASATSGLTFAGQRGAIQQHHRRWPEQQRSICRFRAGKLQSGSGPRVPGAHQFV